ncbi:hypothetical protein T484DRAFT_1916790, partial [Baffinella frigidus]
MSSPSGSGLRQRKQPQGGGSADAKDAKDAAEKDKALAAAFQPRDGAPQQAGEQAAGVLVAVTVLAVYVRTMYRSVPGGDSGELIVAGCTVGIAHPPGYPLFTMLAILFHALPLGGLPAWRINLLSVVLSTASAWFNFKAVVRWDGGGAGGAGGG